MQCFHRAIVILPADCSMQLSNQSPLQIAWSGNDFAHFSNPHSGKRNAEMTKMICSPQIDFPENGRRRVVIENVTPQIIDGGRYPIKRVVGESVLVEADIFVDGHDL